MKFEYVFLDWDGVLYNSFDVHYQSIANIFKAFGLKIPSKEIYGQEIGKGTKRFYLENGFDKIAGNNFENIFKEIQKLWVKNNYQDCRLFEGARETLEFLKNNQFIIAIISSNIHDHVPKIIRKLNLPVDKIYTGDKAINLKLAIDELYVKNPQKILFVDDIAENLKIANDYQMTTCGASYGFDSKKNLEKVANYIIDNVSELIKLLKTLK